MCWLTTLFHNYFTLWTDASSEQDLTIVNSSQPYVHIQLHKATEYTQHRAISMGLINSVDNTYTIIFFKKQQIYKNNSLQVPR